MVQNGDRCAAQVVITGKVQGVGFRQFVRQRAIRLELAGWVQNRDDGSSVELLTEGPSEHVSKLLDQVNAGPPGARVESVDVEWTTPQGLPTPFEIRR